jgi:5-methylcytosine-specific restriction endonuclease McrBC regulatory subunit McrC
MVWEMSAIYEKAIGIKVREFVKSKLHPDCKVIFQGKLDKNKDLLSPGHTIWNSYLTHSIQEESHSSDKKTHTGVFRLKPDIMIISPQNEVLAVLDTKWKNYSGTEAIRARRRRKCHTDDPSETTYKNVSKEDAYQMLSYACAKKSGKDAPEPLVGLLFPSLQSNAPEELYFTNLKSRLHLCWVPVTEAGLNNFDLESILGSKAFEELRTRTDSRVTQELSSPSQSS